MQNKFLLIFLFFDYFLQVLFQNSGGLEVRRELENIVLILEIFLNF